MYLWTTRASFILDESFTLTGIILFINNAGYKRFSNPELEIGTTLSRFGSVRRSELYLVDFHSPFYPILNCTGVECFLAVVVDSPCCHFSFHLLFGPPTGPSCWTYSEAVHLPPRPARPEKVIENFGLSLFTKRQRLLVEIWVFQLVVRIPYLSILHHPRTDLHSLGKYQ